MIATDGLRPPLNRCSVGPTERHEPQTRREEASRLRPPCYSERVFGWFRKPLPPVAPLVDYMVTVHVRLAEAQVGRDGATIGGYYRVLGLRSTPDARTAMIESCVTDGVILWDDSEARVIDVREADRRITKPLRNPFGAGIWHQSGRVFYPDESGESQSESPGPERGH